MKRMTLMMSAALTLGLSATAALAQIDARALGERYLSEGYTRVEVTIGPDDVKVEAIKGATEIEVIYDRLTGAILEQETGLAAAEDRARTGLEVRERARNAFHDDDDHDGDDRGRGRGRGGDDDHGDDHEDDDDDRDGDDRGGERDGDRDDD